jgi:hypothetical protein
MLPVVPAYFDASPSRCSPRDSRHSAASAGGLAELASGIDHKQCVPYASKRMQLAAAGCRLGATCGIIRVSYHPKVGLDRDYSPASSRALLLSCRYPCQWGCRLHEAAHWKIFWELLVRHAAHDSGRPQKRRGTRVVLARLPMRRVGPGCDLSIFYTRQCTEHCQPTVAMQRLQGPV